MSESDGAGKKTRLGKKDAKGARDRAQLSSSSQEHDDTNRTPDIYVCSGHFKTEFETLCRRNSITTVLEILPRAKRPVSPPPQPEKTDEKAKANKKNDPKNQAPPPEPEPQPILDPNYEPPPKTYVTKDKFEYFKPAIFVEMDNPDKQDTVTEVYIRGWKLETSFLNIFQQVFPKMERLHTINLWHCGLTDETLEHTAAVVRECRNLKHLIVDNNPTFGELYHLLIKDESPVQHLSLRYNCITDKGAQLLGDAIGTLVQQNQKLLTLNLTGNRITDEGVKSLAKGLRMNRTLLALNLANNDIGNLGARRLAEVLSHFPMTHEEIVARRKLQAEKGAADERKLSSPVGRRADSRDRDSKDARPPSVRSNHSVPPASKGKPPKSGGKGEQTKKGKDDDKHDKNKGKKPEPEKKVADKKSSIGNQLDPKAGATKKGDNKKKKGAVPDPDMPDMPEVISPLLDKVDYTKDSVPLLVGNRTLLNLGLAYNHIEEEGMRYLLDALKFQANRISKVGNNFGCLRINIHKNKVPDPENNAVVKEIATFAVTRNPLNKEKPAEA